jgi:hypothetical protein
MKQFQIEYEKEIAHGRIIIKEIFEKKEKKLMEKLMKELNEKNIFWELYEISFKKIKTNKYIIDKNTKK